MNFDAFFNGFWFYSILAGWSTWQWVFLNFSQNFWSFDTPDTPGCASAVIWNRFEPFLLQCSACSWTYPVVVMAACTLHQHWGMLKGAETLFKLATKAFAVKTTMCNEKALIHVITRSVVRGHSTTTWTTFYPILTTYPTRVDKHGHFIYGLSFAHVDFLLTTYLPFLVHVVIECPQSCSRS